MKLKAYYKNVFQNIKTTKARFISIFIIVFLGASVFAGLQHTPKIMNNSMANFISDLNYPDLKLIGTFGFDLEDIKSISKIDGVVVNASYQFDGLMTYQKRINIPIQILTKTSFKDKFNQVQLVAGKFPVKDNEIILNYASCKEEGYKLNQKVMIKTNNGSKEFIISGIFKSGDHVGATYDLNQMSNTNNLVYAYILQENNQGLAIPDSLVTLRPNLEGTVLNIKVVSFTNIFDSNYLKKLDVIKNKIETIANKRYQNLYQDLKDQANSQIVKAKEEYQKGNNKFQEANKKYQKGYQEYQDGLSKYQAGLNKYLKGKEEYQNSLKQYEEGLSLYHNKLSIFNKGKEKYLVGLNQYEDGLKKYQDGMEKVKEYDLAYSKLKQEEPTISNLKANLIELKEQYQDALNNNQVLASSLLEQIKILEQKIQEFDQAMASLLAKEDFINKSRLNLSLAKQELDSKKIELDKADKEIKDGQIKLNNSKVILDKTNNLLKKSKEDLGSNKIKLDSSKIQLDAAKKQLDFGKEKLNQASLELEQGRKKIEDGQNQITKLKQGKIYYLTRQENSGLVSFEGASKSMGAIALVFPVLFFLVAGLVSLTTMTRMVEEQRVKGGTLRSLGYSKKHVINEYLIYAFLATFFAAVLGIVFGVYFFPNIIFYLYSLMLFKVQVPIAISFDIFICFITLIGSVLLILLITYYVCNEALKEVPASLLRPKAPKAGKRILLERIKYIWSRLSFNQKVTLRNIFRYKKRFIMSVVGIAGCSALIVMAFGLLGSIRPIIDKQFALWDSDASINLNTDYDFITLNETQARIKDLKGVKDLSAVYQKQIKLKNYYLNVVVPVESTSFEKINKLVDLDNSSIKLNDDGVVISQKLQELLKVKIGDKIVIDLDDINYQVKVVAINRNYFQHYLYMSPAYYKNLTNNVLKPNYVLLSYQKSKLSQKQLIDYVNKDKHLKGLSFTKEKINLFNKQLNSINSVVVILVLMAAILNFVVLYNLTNINIQERKNEIATIKVLGFYKREVADYIFRENYLLSIIGLLFGLVLGYGLHQFVIHSVELEQVLFIRNISWWVYLVSAIFTLVFTVVINKIMGFSISKVDMVESLKSVE